jgi:steroid 5-alpha reductase family enzyme
VKATVVVVPVPQGDSFVPHELDEGAERRYVRCNQQMSKRVYRAQVVRHVFGVGAARMFMRLMQVDAAVAQRVLRSPLSKLRR